MSSSARIALGTVQPEARPQPVAWALLEVLSRQGLQIQHFLSQACFLPGNVATTITGLCSRHLDSWVMSQEICREIYLRGTSSVDMGVVEGRYFPQSETVPCGSRLGDLCDWLDLARIAIVDVRHLELCRLPPRPRQLEGVILEMAAGSSEQVRIATHFETMWGVPVLGCLEISEALCQELETLDQTNRPAGPLCQELGERLAGGLNLQRLLRLAGNRGRLEPPPPRFDSGALEQPVCVAVAFDAAFHCYFADTLDLLELCGATVADFSPLKDESLPPESDIVYFGCGHPERFARELAHNHCMQTALRNHVCAGKRLYAEGGGLAYLCREIETPDGQRLPMVGAFPAVARMNASAWTPLAYEAELASGNWLGRAGARWRGYLNAGWQLDAAPELTPCLSDPEHRGELVARHHALGSRLHLNFAAHPEALASFLRTHAASLQWQGRTP
jgi:cobyrinic acid a,c-diamide synthase